MTLTATCALTGILAWLCGGSQFEAAQKPLYLIAYLTGGWAPVKAVIEATLQRKLDVNFLMVLAAIGAAAIGDWGEGATLLFLFSLSGALEKITLERTARSIEALVELRPDTALLIRDGAESRVPVDSLQVGARVRILPAERVSVDGVVLEGKTAIDQSTITGESMPLAKQPGDEVFAGTLNQRGTIVVEVSRPSNETTLAKIVKTVREAQDEKADTERFVQRWQKPYVLCVLGGSGLMLIWHLFFPHAPHLDGIHTFSTAFRQAMVLLVGASPCAVVIATPAATLAGITRAARLGVLFKGGAYIEKLADAQVVALDKTGTITEGKPAVSSVWCPARIENSTLTAEDRLLQLAASVEQRSEHPLAQAVVAAARARNIPLLEASDFDSHTGLGAHAKIDNLWVGIGRAELFRTHGMKVPDELLEARTQGRADGQTVLLVMTREGIFGSICVADSIRPEAAGVIRRIRSLGVKHIAILTGDHASVGNAVAKAVGADTVAAGLLPEKKVIEIARLHKQFGTVIMVGDGVNDAPALGVADIGVAMGGAGTDIALETADVVIMKDDLRGIATALWLSQRTRAAISRGLLFAFTVIAVLIVGALLTDMKLWLAVLMHEGSTVFTIFSGLYLLVEKAPEEAVTSSQT